MNEFIDCVFVTFEGVCKICSKRNIQKHSSYGTGFESQNAAGGQNPAPIDVVTLSCIADFRPSASLFGAIVTKGSKAISLLHVFHDQSSIERVVGLPSLQNR